MQTFLDEDHDLEMVERIHDYAPLLPVVFVTGRLNRLWGRAPQEREAHLDKPFTRRQLVAAIQSVFSPIVRQGAPWHIVKTARPQQACGQGRLAQSAADGARR